MGGIYLGNALLTHSKVENIIQDNDFYIKADGNNINWVDKEVCTLNISEPTNFTLNDILVAKQEYRDIILQIDNLDTNEVKITNYLVLESFNSNTLINQFSNDNFIATINSNATITLQKNIKAAPIEDYIVATDEGELTTELPETFGGRTADEYALKTDLENAGGVQPDWSQNDETSSDYVKNRTHWEEVSWEEVLPLTTVDGFTAVGENGVYRAYYEMPALDNNSFYSIKFDGVEYFGLGGSLMSNNVAKGNAPATENEAPFCFVEEYFGTGTYDYYVYVYADGESHTFDILKHIGDIHKIDKKFLPTLIGSKTYNNGEIFNNAMNASYYAHAEGFKTIASGNSSHAEGYDSTASGWSSHSENYSTTASGNSSHAEGDGSTASGNGSHAEGYYSIASGNGSHAEGSGSTASGNSSHAEGDGSTASGGCSHAEGGYTIASGSCSHAECGGNSAPAMTFSSAYYPIIGSNDIEISNTTAYGESSHAEGGNTFAYGEFSHAEGINTGALGKCSHAEGESSIALGEYSHAEGVNVQAIGNWSHAEGGNTEASGYSSHAEGFISVASGSVSHAEGGETIASGNDSHAEGFKTTASGKRSHAEGWGTIANSDDQHVQGRYNISDSENKYLHIVGNGNQNMDGVRSNAHTLDWDGNAWFAGDIEAKNAIILTSSTKGSTKRFKITVDDSGLLTASEI